MPDYTKHCKLIKPTADEYYDIGVFNQNSEIADEQIKSIRDQLQKLAISAGDWKLLQTYIDPGAVTWTAPDLLGDGSPYDIGVCVIGGGAGGGWGYPGGWRTAAGGSSGFVYCYRALVSPREVFYGVVGNGGIGGNYGDWNGKNGETTVFMGHYVYGGEFTNHNYSLGRPIGASPGALQSNVNFLSAVGGIGGAASAPVAEGQTTKFNAGQGIYAMDIFNPARKIACGGSTGSAGRAMGVSGGGSGSGQDMNGEPGTGSGGGGCSGAHSGDMTTEGGKGGSGSICIYVRRTTA